MTRRNILIEDQEYSSKKEYESFKYFSEKVENSIQARWSSQLRSKKASLYFNISKAMLPTKLRQKTIGSKRMEHCLCCSLKKKTICKIDSWKKENCICNA